MNHFFQVASGVDVLPLLSSLFRQPELWNKNDLRTTHPETPHKEVSDIWVFFNDIKEDCYAAIEDLQTYPYPAWEKLPHLRPIIFDLMRRVEATQLGRVVISKLPPGKEIDPHIDQGTPATFFSRFQIALQCEPGCKFIIEDESIQMKPGDVWLINNKAMHSVVNNSSSDRIALIVDLRIA